MVSTYNRVWLNYKMANMTNRSSLCKGLLTFFWHINITLWHLQYSLCQCWFVRRWRATTGHNVPYVYDGALRTLCVKQLGRRGGGIPGRNTYFQRIKSYIYEKTTWILVWVVTLLEKTQYLQEKICLYNQNQVTWLTILNV